MASVARPAPPPVAPKPNRVGRAQASLTVNTDLLKCENAAAESLTNVQKQSYPQKSNSERELADLTTKLLLNMEQVSKEPEFAGICDRCDVMIKGSEGACTAMDKFYHTDCFTCETCSRALSGHSFYAVEGQVLCEGCYVNTLEKCCLCNLPVTERILRATGKVYHPECFTCSHCSQNLDSVPFTVDAHNKIHCIDDFHMKYAPRCSVCREAILPDSHGSETVRVVALDRNFHVDCYKCESCAVVMSADTSENGCFPVDGRLFCKKCSAMQSMSPSSGASSPLTATSDL